MQALFLAVILVALALFAPQSGSATPGEVLVPRADGVRLYKLPNSTAPVLHELDRSHRLLEFRRQGEWVKVAVFRMAGGRGWVHSADVVAERAIQEPPPAKPARHGSRSAADEDVIHRFVLDVDGTPAIEFRASCRVAARGEEEQKFEFAGLMPNQAVAEARAISCVVRKADASGRLRVTLLTEDVPVAAAGTRAAFNWISVRSDGPWGPARGIRGSVTLVFPKVTRPSRGRTIIPPMGDPVPALRMR